MPAVPAEGLVWDTSSLFTDGRLYVRDASSVEVLEEDVVQVSSVVEDELIIQVPSTADVVIYTVSGSKVGTRHLNGETTGWNVSGLPAGMYIVDIWAEHTRVTRRFVKK